LFKKCAIRVRGMARTVSGAGSGGWHLYSTTSGCCAIWLMQIAREAGAKLATCDAGNLTNWPDNTIPVGATV
jgi:hypothetical protein